MGSIEISLLSELVPIRAPGEVSVGEHGLAVTLGGRHGLLLPQVVARYGWDSVRFCEEACRKAGLPPNSWRKGAVIERFSAQVFGEARGGADQG